MFPLSEEVIVIPDDNDAEESASIAKTKKVELQVAKTKKVELWQHAVTHNLERLESKCEG